MCHLCDLAYEIVDAAAVELDMTYTVVDIIDDDALYEAFKTTIPVLRNQKGQHLNWPFTLEQVKRFLS